jgi:hypothetical protein
VLWQAGQRRATGLTAPYKIEIVQFLRFTLALPGVVSVSSEI